MTGHLVYIALLVCFIAVSAALALIAVRVFGRLTSIAKDDLILFTIVNPILTAFFVLMMLTAPDFVTAPLTFLLGSLPVGFVLPLSFLVAWSIWQIGAKFVALIDRCLGAKEGE
jgi:hypothetical protein